MSIAFKIAEKSHCKHPFSIGMAGRGWFWVNLWTSQFNIKTHVSL